MGRVLDVERLAGISTTTPLSYAAANFGSGLAGANTLPGILNISIRPSGGDIHLGVAGKTASATVGFLVKDGEVWEYDDDIRALNILALAANTNLYLLYEAE